MIVVRETFIAHPGMASKLAKVMKGVVEAMGADARVMTDLVGEFNQVVMETKFKNLGEFEERMKEYSSNPDVGKVMSGYTDLFQTGTREIFTIQ